MLETFLLCFFSKYSLVSLVKLENAFSTSGRARRLASISRSGIATQLLVFTIVPLTDGFPPTNPASRSRDNRTFPATGTRSSFTIFAFLPAITEIKISFASSIPRERGLFSSGESGCQLSIMYFIIKPLTPNP